MTEFTGERVIPGEVNDDLWAEHVARYAFASRFAAGRRVLDLGCGTGYGAAELAHRATAAAGIDSAFDAVAYAREHYPLAGIHFLQASATALPFRQSAFDLITAFEVIEHLADYRSLLSEARRVLAPGGVFLVSTPNTLYYAESRAEDGPNPFHTHEFEFAEFRDTLSEFFPHVTLLLQNRLESFVFSPAVSAIAPLDARIDGTRGSADEAHFFIGVCAVDSPPDLCSFLYVPRASNMLREREYHIRLLEEDLAKTIAEHKKLIELHSGLTEHLQEHNRWALQLESNWKAAQQRIVQLQDELKAQQDQAMELVAKLDTNNKELGETVRLLDKAEATVVERTHWAEGLQKRLDRLSESRWLKLGRNIGLGPKVE